MNLKDRLAEKKSALLELEPMLKSEDVSAETIEKGEGLVKEIADLESQIEAAEKASAVLSTIGTTEENTNNDITEVKKMSVMEDFTKKCAEITDKKSGAKVHFETKANTDVVLAPQIADVDKSIAPVGSRTPAASLFTETQISGNAITYFIEGAFEGTPAQLLRVLRNLRYQHLSHLRHLHFPRLPLSLRKQTKSLQMHLSLQAKSRTHLCIR